MEGSIQNIFERFGFIGEGTSSWTNTVELNIEGSGIQGLHEQFVVKWLKEGHKWHWKLTGNVRGQQVLSENGISVLSILSLKALSEMKFVLTGFPNGRGAFSWTGF